MEVAQFRGGVTPVVRGSLSTWSRLRPWCGNGRRRMFTMASWEQRWGIVSLIRSYIMILVKYIEILDVSCTIDEIIGLAKVSRLPETSTGSNRAQRSVKMAAGVVVEFGPWGSGLYSGFSVVESDIYCRIWCHMFVKTVRTVRIRYAFTQIVMIRSHFHCQNTVEILILQ